MFGDDVTACGEVIHARVQPQFAKLVLPLHGTLGHPVRDAKALQGNANLAHLGGATNAMHHHAFKIVGPTLAPVETRVGGLQRSEHGILDASAAGGEQGTHW